MNKKEVLLLIPVYNEEKYIGEVLREIRKYTADDILIVNDTSTDNSLSIIQETSSILTGNTHILSHNSNEGYGKSLIDGFNYSIQKHYQLILTIDGDGQHEPENIPHFIHAMRDSTIDIVSGSRYLNSDLMVRKAPVERLKINQEITKIINRVTGYRLTDSFCGFKIYRVDSLKKFQLTEKGYGLPLQLFIQAARNHLVIKELPVDLIYTNEKRTFGPVLDDENIRLQYYIKIINKELKRG